MISNRDLVEKTKPPNYEFGSKVGSELSFLKKKEGKCFIIKHSPSSVSGPTWTRTRDQMIMSHLL